MLIKNNDNTYSIKPAKIVENNERNNFNHSWSVVANDLAVLRWDKAPEGYNHCNNLVDTRTMEVIASGSMSRLEPMIEKKIILDNWII